MKLFKLSLLVSLLAHGALLFWTSSKEEQSTVALEAQRELHAHHGETFKVILRIEESELPKLKRVLEGRKKVTPKKVEKKKTIKVARKTTPSQKAQARREKQEGEKKLNQYITELRQFIENQKSYPRKAARLKQSGSVEVELEIDQHGHFVKVELKKASHFNTLNRAALKLVQQISHFKPLPIEMGGKITLSVPLRYSLKR